MNCASTSIDANHPTCEYAVLMVVHDALDVVRISTLKTLRHIAGASARLVVVDSGSSDGAEVWLDLLARRGDIDLIRVDGNVSHGPGLELARSRTTQPMLITLDSDAFPISDGWIEKMRERLQGRVRLTGILHHRGYIHPSCLMIRRSTLDEAQLTFLDEMHSRPRLDVAERISVDLKRRGFEISGLRRTASQRRGSVSEPVDLGAEYEGLVYHQWYTTRSVIAGGGRVDDVPPAAIRQSLDELQSRFQNEPREATIVVGVRVQPGEVLRERNAMACLRALNLQDVPRWKYRIVVVEQDSEPRLEACIDPYVDGYLFARNPGRYNRGWGFNVGAASVPVEGALCLIDADLIVPPDFLRRALDALTQSGRAIIPFETVIYLDRPSSDRLIETGNASGCTGQAFHNSEGGCVWVAAALYRDLGGHDQRFRGWGYEDREFCRRLCASAGLVRLPGKIYHLHHEVAESADCPGVMENERLFHAIQAGEDRGSDGAFGDIHRYASEQPGAGSRDWEHWNQWQPTRIEGILRDERNHSLRRSARALLARRLGRLGDSVLDVGCGPGALWEHLKTAAPGIRLIGADVTRGMLATARRRFPDVPVALADAGKLPFADHSFDTVVMRHMLEHLPPWLKDAALSEAMRVARSKVVLDFFIAPLETGKTMSHRTLGFLETQWTREDITAIPRAQGWNLYERFALSSRTGEPDEVWILAKGGGAPETPAYGEKISIVMPTYRRPHTLLRAIDSVRAQTYRNWELILVDNSGDGHYEFSDPRIAVHVYAACASASYARNRGLAHVTGDLVCFFDDDDEMFPNYLETFADVFRRNPGARLARCGMLIHGVHKDFSHATPECCVRRELASPSWENSGCHDQVYFTSLVSQHEWSQENGSVVVIPDVLCRANSDRLGGLREGNL